MTVPRIVIIGAGFAGAYTAKWLRRKLGRQVEIELINETNYFVFQPLLPEVASGTINAQDAVTPLRLMIPGIKFRMAEVRDIDFNNNCVHLLQGSRRKRITAAYDQLVIANGQETNLNFLPGFNEHSLTLKNLADAHHLRNVVVQRLEHADVTQDKVLKQRLLTFVVAGGGFSGVETIGEMSEMIRRIIKYYPNIQPHELRGILVQRDKRILPELPAQLAEYAHRQLHKRGIDIRLNTGLKSASAQSVELDNGELIPTATLVSTIGNGPSRLMLRLAEQQGLPLQHGKIVTAQDMQVQGFENVWAVGDTALIPLLEQPQQRNDYAPPTAQFAVREARCLAANISARLQSRPTKAFCYSPKGSLASIGNYKAVAEVFGLRFSGVIAWSMWRGFYMLMLPGFVTKMRIALNWFLDYFIPRTIVQVSTRRSRAARYARYRAGEEIFAAGQIADGFYAVVSGELESRYTGEDGGEDRVRRLTAGDHWGDALLSGDLQAVGSLTAKTDCEVLILERADFNALRTTLPPLEQYLQSHLAEKVGQHEGD